MLSCKQCACDCFQATEASGLVWMACHFCGALQESAACPVPIVPWLMLPVPVRTGLELHRITNADGLENRR